MDCLKFPEKQKGSRRKLPQRLYISVGNIIKIVIKMKKFLFSALAVVAFAGSGFASNEMVTNVNEQHNVIVKSIYKDTQELQSAKPNCFVTVSVYDSRGRFLRNHYFEATTMTEDGCADYAESTRNFVTLMYQMGIISIV